MTDTHQIEQQLTQDVKETKSQKTTPELPIYFEKKPISRKQKRRAEKEMKKFLAAVKGIENDFRKDVEFFKKNSDNYQRDYEEAFQAANDRWIRTIRRLAKAKFFKFTVPNVNFFYNHYTPVGREKREFNTSKKDQDKGSSEQDSSQSGTEEE